MSSISIGCNKSATSVISGEGDAAAFDADNQKTLENLAKESTASLIGEDEGLSSKVFDFIGMPKSYRKTLYEEYVPDIGVISNISSDTASSFLGFVNWICGKSDSESGKDETHHQRSKQYELLQDVIDDLPLQLTQSVVYKVETPFTHSSLQLELDNYRASLQNSGDGKEVKKTVLEAMARESSKFPTETLTHDENGNIVGTEEKLSEIAPAADVSGDNKVVEENKLEKGKPQTEPREEDATDKLRKSNDRSSNQDDKTDSHLKDTERKEEEAQNPAGDSSSQNTIKPCRSEHSLDINGNIEDKSMLSSKSSEEFQDAEKLILEEPPIEENNTFSPSSETSKLDDANTKISMNDEMQKANSEAAPIHVQRPCSNKDLKNIDVDVSPESSDGCLPTLFIGEVEKENSESTLKSPKEVFSLKKPREIEKYDYDFYVEDYLEHIVSISREKLHCKRVTFASPPSETNIYSYCIDSEDEVEKPSVETQDYIPAVPDIEVNALSVPEPYDLKEIEPESTLVVKETDNEQLVSVFEQINREESSTKFIKEIKLIVREKDKSNNLTSILYEGGNEEPAPYFNEAQYDEYHSAEESDDRGEGETITSYAEDEPRESQQQSAPLFDTGNGVIVKDIIPFTERNADGKETFKVMVQLQLRFNTSSLY